MAKEHPDQPYYTEFEIAIAWLETNEGDIEEHTACRKVAGWLIDKVNDMKLKQVAREAGVSVVRLRKRLKEKQRQDAASSKDEKST